MENQWQHFKDSLLPIGQGRMGTIPALPVDSHEPVPQPAQRFSVYTLIKVQGNRSGLDGQGDSAGEVLSDTIISMMTESWQNRQKNKSGRTLVRSCHNLAEAFPS
jgi:hypothetical protein